MPIRVKLEESSVAEPDSDLVSQGLSDNELNDTEDEIVREMDVYLSPELAHQLYLLQYPLKQFNSRSHQDSPLAARIKPRHNMLELDHGIPTNYIEQEGTIHLTQRTFASHTVPVTTHLAFGKVVVAADGDGHALHLAPLSHITQMRPTFTHLDMNDMDNIRSMEEQQEKAAAAQAKLDRKPLMFQKKESERAALARKNSYAHKRASEEGEQWMELQVLDMDDLDSAMEEDLPSEDELQVLRHQLECPVEARSQAVVDAENRGQKDANSDGNNNKQTPSLGLYVRSLDYLPPSNYHEAEDELRHPNIVDWVQVGLDESAFDLPTLGAHITALLRGGWPIPYSILRQTLPPLVKKKDVLTALAACAVMVRGNFCLQSRLMPRLPRSVAKARTFIMLLIQCVGVVHRTRLFYVFGIGTTGTKNDRSFADEALTAEVILMLLEQLGKKTPYGWIIRGQDDVKFALKHPQNTELHMQYWGRQMIRFKDYFQRYASAVV